MVIEGVDPVVLSKLINHQVEQVTCIECCKYFIAPETATCGHSLCHSCWKGRRTCHTCAAPVERKALKLNIPLQTFTEHVHGLADSFEKIFKVKLNEFTLDAPDDNQSNDPTKHVKEWLASSENHFSGPVSSQASVVEVLPAAAFSKSKIQVHTHKKKTQSPVKVVHKPQPQEDWDKIEVLPDSEDICKRPKDHGVEPMEIEPFLVDDTEYTTDNPRRSSRKKDLKADLHLPAGDVSVDKNSGKISTNDTDKKSIKSKQTWSNVKKMKKEFGKLNKNKSKLNVSIEMVKKAQNALKQQKLNTPPEKPLLPPVESEPMCYNIDDNTPIVTNNSKESGSRNNSITYGKENTSLNRNKTNSKNGTLESIIKQKETTNSSKSISQSKISNTENRNDQNDEHVNISQNNDNIKFSSKQSEVNVSVNEAIKTCSMPFIKKSALCRNSTSEENCVKVTQKENDSNTMTTSTDDIEISIKIRNTITNIVIKNKGNDVQMKVGTDREIQTSLGPHALSNTTDVACSPIHIQNVEICVGDGNKVAVAKTATKINTASVETATATPHFDITDSVEKELSDVMECLERNRAKSVHKTPFTPKATKNTQCSPRPSDKEKILEKSPEPIKTNVPEASQSVIEPASSSQPVLQPPSGKNKDAISEEVEDLNDIDIFNSGSVKEACVKLLKDSQNGHSEILMPTVKSKKSQKVVEKRDRETDNEELPCSKKLKIHNQETKINIQDNIEKPTENDSEPMNYDAIMSQVFANIDAEIQSGKSKDVVKQSDKNKNLNKLTQVKSNKITSSESDHNQIQLSQIIHKTQTRQVNKEIPVEVQENATIKEIPNQKYSENVFSMIEKDSESLATSEKVTTKLQEAQGCTQQQIDNLLTPGMCRDIVSSANNSQTDKEIVMMETDLGTPTADHDDSDGVVEETPQKSLSFVKPRQTVTNLQPLQRQKTNDTVERETPSDSQIIKSIINISDTTVELSKDKDVTVLSKRKETETPLTINKFVNHIKHNSTPVARKSLHFEDHSEDPEQTLCPTTTQEKEIIADAFEPTPKSPVKRALGLRNVQDKNNRQFFVAGTCLTAAEVKNIKLLCQERGWTYLDKYTKELTHLVVGVDEENKSQRSVKYMCALAASKWIVSYDWVEKCLQLKTVVDELPYEALDACGEPGPKRSRTATRKLFEGFTFYCMPPFSVLDMATLKDMLEAAGATIAQEPSGVRVTADSGIMPALLLAEPEHTQEDRFVYLAIEHKVVPVNYEWALNCLGTYSLGSILDLLLCPASLLPPATENWPAVLIMQDEEEESNFDS